MCRSRATAVLPGQLIALGGGFAVTFRKNSIKKVKPPLFCPQISPHSTG